MYQLGVQIDKRASVYVCVCVCVFFPYPQLCGLTFTLYPWRAGSANDQSPDSPVSTLFALKPSRTTTHRDEDVMCTSCP